MLRFLQFSVENSPYLVIAKLIKLYQLVVFTDSIYTWLKYFFRMILKRKGINISAYPLKLTLS